MSPAISTGAMAIAQNVPAADLDVVMVKTDDGTRITHRIVKVTQRTDGATLALKGDANTVPDAQVYDVAQADRVWFAIPKVGYVVSWLSGPIGLFLLGAYATFLPVVLFGKGDGPNASRGGGARKATGSMAALIVVVGAGTSGLMVSRASPTLAAWTNTAGVAGTTLTAHTVQSHAQPLCTDVNGFLGLGNIARLTWNHVDTRYEYFWELRQTNGTVVNSGFVPASAQAQGSTVTLNISTDLVGSNGDYNVVVRARLSSSTAWTAASTTTTPVTRSSVVIIGTSMRCD